MNKTKVAQKCTIDLISCGLRKLYRIEMWLCKMFCFKKLWPVGWRNNAFSVKLQIIRVKLSV